MKTFVTDQHEYVCGTIVKIGNKDTLIVGKPGERVKVGGNLWGVWGGRWDNDKFVPDWRDAREIVVRLIEKDPIRKMVKKAWPKKIKKVQ